MIWFIIIEILLFFLDYYSSDWTSHAWNGKTYYYNTNTGVSQWEPPQELVLVSQDTSTNKISQKSSHSSHHNTLIHRRRQKKKHFNQSDQFLNHTNSFNQSISSNATSSLLSAPLDINNANLNEQSNKHNQDVNVQETNPTFNEYKSKQNAYDYFNQSPSNQKYHEVILPSNSDIHQNNEDNKNDEVQALHQDILELKHMNHALNNQLHSLNKNYYIVCDNLVKCEKNRQKLLKQLKSSKVGKEKLKVNITATTTTTDTSITENEDAMIESYQNKFEQTMPNTSSIPNVSIDYEEMKESIKMYKNRILEQEKELIEAYTEIESMKLDLKNLAVSSLQQIKQRWSISKLFSIFNIFKSKKSYSSEWKTIDIKTSIKNKKRLKSLALSKALDTKLMTVYELNQTIVILESNYSRIQDELKLKEKTIEALQHQIYQNDRLDKGNRNNSINKEDKDSIFGNSTRIKSITISTEGSDSINMVDLPDPRTEDQEKSDETSIYESQLVSLHEYYNRMISELVRKIQDTVNQIQNYKLRMFLERVIQSYHFNELMMRNRLEIDNLQLQLQTIQSEKLLLQHRVQHLTNKMSDMEIDAIVHQQLQTSYQTNDYEKTSSSGLNSIDNSVFRRMLKSVTFWFNRLITFPLQFTKIFLK